MLAAAGRPCIATPGVHGEWAEAHGRRVSYMWARERVSVSVYVYVCVCECVCVQSGCMRVCV